jgi:tagatose-1,6-bisphosphate aldolase non-catalytic subunit AgaZ/GatZ
LLAAAPLDPDCLRAALDIRSVLKLPEEIFRSDPTLAERAAKLATTAEDVAALGPSREQLVTMANA